MGIKKKVITSVMLLVFVITGVFIAVFLQYSKKSIDNYINLRIKSVQMLINSYEYNNRKKYRGRLKSFVKYNTSPSRDFMFKAFEQRNREELLMRSKLFFDLFKKEDPNFSTMAWITHDNYNFLRVHNSKKFGDDISLMRSDILYANQTKTLQSGYVLAGTGILYSVIHPVYYMDNHIGIIQFGIKIDYLLDTIYKNFKFPVGLLIFKEKYKFVTRASIPVFSRSSYIIQSKNLSFFEKISDQVDWTLNRQRVYLNGKTYVLLNVLSLLDYKKQSQGSIITVLDISKQLHEIKNRTLLIIGLSIILLIGSFLILYFSFGSLLRKITDLNNNLEKNNRTLQGKSNELQQERNRLEFIINSANLGTWDWNIKTGEVIFNERWTEIIGYKLSEIEPNLSVWEKLIHPDEAEEVNKVLTDHLEGHMSIYKTEHRLLHKSGKWVWVLDVGKVFTRDKDGKPLRVLGIHIDITKEKKKEEKKLELNRQEEAKKRFESLTTMAGAIAHRFNNAMAVVHGNLELLTLSYPDNSDLVLKVSNALTAANGASQVGSMMLSFIGQQPIELQELSFANLIEESLDELSFYNTSIKINFILPEQQLYVSVDKLQIKDVIKNILLNSEESYDGVSGDIDIVFGTEFYSKDSFPMPFQNNRISEGMYSYCEIRDAGHGIVPENMQRIFEPFYTTNFVGRGLGLALSVGIMQAHQGAIVIKSKENIGTTVRVLLPYIELPIELISNNKIVRQVKQFAGNILFADDEKMVLDIGKQRLERLGFTVDTAKNGLEAVELFSKEKIDYCAVIMDVSMPKMDGIEAMTAIKKINSEIPIILSSGYSEDKIFSNKNSDIRPDFFLMKPFLIDELRSVLQKLLS